MDTIIDLPGDDEVPTPARSERWLWSLLVASPLLLVFGGLVAVAALSRATIVGKDGVVRLEYDRLDRFTAPTTLRVRLSSAAARGKDVRLVLSYGYMEAVNIKGVLPAPERVESAAQGVAFVFAPPPKGKPMTVVFEVEGKAYGAVDGELAIGRRPEIDFRQILLP